MNILKDKELHILEEKAFVFTHDTAKRFFLDQPSDISMDVLLSNGSYLPVMAIILNSPLGTDAFVFLQEAAVIIKELYGNDVIHIPPTKFQSLVEMEIVFEEH